MMGTRGDLARKAGSAVTVHGPQPIDKGHFDEDVWQLFHIDVDRSEAHDLAEQEPERLAGDGRALEQRGREVRRAAAVGPRRARRSSRSSSRCPSRRAASTPTTRRRSRCPERSAANTHGVSYRILAEVELTDDAEGVIMAHGSRFGGHALFIKDHRLHYVYNFLGIPPEQRLAGDAALDARQAHPRRRLRQGVGRRARRVARHRDALRRRPGRGDGGDPHADRATSRSAARACASASTAATTSPASTATSSRSRAARSSRSSSTSATTPTSTSRSTSQAAFARD